MNAGELWLDPELAAALREVPWADRPQSTIDPARLEPARDRLRRGGEPPDGRTVRSDRVQVARPDGTELSLRVHRPGQGVDTFEGRAVLVWLHGGGYLLGSAASDPRVEREYADRVGCAVVGVDYRTAPEHPHPAAFDDVRLAIDWIRGSLQGAPASSWIGVAGESAGAGLAAAVALADHDLDFQLLVAPMLDDRTGTEADRAVDALGLWSSDLNHRAWQLYLGVEPAASAPLAAAARASSLSGVAPAYLDVGTADLFCGETIAHAQRLAASRVPVELHVWPGAYHGFYEVAPRAALSLQARETRVRALRRAIQHHRGS